MSQDLRCKHDISIKRKVAELVDVGLGWDPISSRLAIPKDTVKQWIMIYRAIGMDGLLNMGSSKKAYDYETRLAAEQPRHKRPRPSNPDGNAADSVPTTENESHHGTPRRLRGNPKATPRPAVVQWEVTSESRGIGWGCNRKAL